MHNKFKGLYAANIIPLNKDRSINYTELKNQAIRLGIYENINQLTPFCGKKIVDK